MRVEENPQVRERGSRARVVAHARPHIAPVRLPRAQAQAFRVTVRTAMAQMSALMLETLRGFLASP